METTETTTAPTEQVAAPKKPASKKKASKPAAKKALAKKSAKKSPKPAQAAAPAAKKVLPASKRDPKKEQVFELMRNPGGATLAAIMKLTGWQPHTVRGFISIAGKKISIASAKNEAGERCYSIVAG